MNHLSDFDTLLYCVRVVHIQEYNLWHVYRVKQAPLSDVALLQKKKKRILCAQL